MPLILLALFVIGLLLAGLVSGATGMSYDSAVGLVLVVSPVIAGAVALRKLAQGRFRSRPTVLRPRTRAESVRQVLDTSAIAQRAMTHAGKLAVRQQEDFLQALEQLASRLDEARDRHGGSEKAGAGAGEFANSKDIPFLLSAFSRETVRNLGTTMLGVQQTAGRDMAAAVNESGVPVPEDLSYPTQWRGIGTRGDSDYG